MKQKGQFEGVPAVSGAVSAVVPTTKPRYCLYARKSTESEERQVLSVDSRVKEMLTLAEREDLDVAEIRREPLGQGHDAAALSLSQTFDDPPQQRCRN